MNKYENLNLVSDALLDLSKTKDSLDFPSGSLVWLNLYKLEEGRLNITIGGADFVVEKVGHRFLLRQNLPQSQAPDTQPLTYLDPNWWGQPTLTIGRSEPGDSKQLDVAIIGDYQSASRIHLNLSFVDELLMIDVAGKNGMKLKYVPSVSKTDNKAEDALKDLLGMSFVTTGTIFICLALGDLRTGGEFSKELAVVLNPMLSDTGVAVVELIARMPWFIKLLEGGLSFAAGGVLFIDDQSNNIH